jgi:serine/threonine protein kinase/tetratricopeptide (TPR) repeat protein
MSETRQPAPGPSDAKEIFVDLCEMASADRAAALEARCGGNPELRAWVQSLLDAHDQAGGFFAGPTVAKGQVGSPVPTPAPRQIGPYKILQEIGEGGFGSVYLAEQESPVRRRVALKLIKPGMDSRQVIARFEAERQALAMMDHPNIARVFDAGATETGRPYFVMELVKGIPITEYCDKQNLTIRQRLDLFAQVCQAVQHAHQKGVIHRDIKPTNVLVSTQDDRALVKVIDFGIAKATQSRLTEKTLFTEFRQLVGTPEYMSPEQAEGSLDIDTRTDVFALGVMLYELLTGTTPFDPHELRSKAYGEIQRVIREVDPPKPSTRLSNMRETLPTVAARRQLEPRKLNSLIRGELDWIVMKAMEKDRSRRYESASGMAADILHYLANEPVAASPPSRVYRARKFVRRHKVALGVTAAMFALLAGGLAGTAWGLIRARRDRDAAIVARNQADAARLAEAEARAYEAGTDKFLTDMFESIDPIESRGKPVLVVDIIDRAVQRLDAEPPKHRKAEASLRVLFARAYHSLGQPLKSLPQAQRAAEIYQAEWPDDFRTANVLGDLARVCIELNRLDEAERAMSESTRISKRVNGDDHPQTINTENGLVEILARRGKYAEADQVLVQLLPRVRRVSGPESEDALAVASVASTVWQSLGRYSEAESLLRESLTTSRKKLGEDHPYTLGFLNNLGMLINNQGRILEAEPVQREAYELAQRVFGADHPSSCTLGNNLALTLDALGRFEEAEKIYLLVIEQRRRLLGDDNPSTLTVRNNYALLLQHTSRLDQAEPIFREIIAKSGVVGGPQSNNAMLWTSNLAWLLVERGDFAGGEAIYRDLLPRARRVLGADHPMMITFTHHYGQSIALQNRWEQAEPLLASAYQEAAARKITETNAGFAAAYGDCLAHLGKMNEAQPVLLGAARVLEAAPNADGKVQQGVAGALIKVYEQLGPPEQVDLWRAKRKAIATQPSTLPTAQP